MTTLWTAEQDAELAIGINNGLSTRLIGNEIGRTRNAVIGRCFRLGLSAPYPKRRVPTVTARVPAREKAKHGENNIFALGRAARAAGLTVAVLELIGRELRTTGI